MKEIKSPFWRSIYEYGLITVSIWIMVVGIYFFKFPNHFAFGGITGFSTVVSQLTHWSASDFTSVTNIALLLFGFLFLGKGFGLKTVYATMVMSVSLSLLERFCPLSAPLTSQPLLELMFAIFLPAVGTAILFNIGASSGGTDIIAMILKKYSSMNIGTVLMLVDIASVVASYFIFGVETGLFSTIGLAAKSLVIDDVIENNSMRVATGVLNEIVTEAVAMQQPPSDKGKRLKIYYVTQVAVKPPTFVIFVNDKELMHFSYTRYLENRIRDAFGFEGTSLKFIIRERKDD